MKLLMHTCCAPCSIYCIEKLREENIEPVLYWYNPNIHPYIEYEKRRDTLKQYSKMIDINVIFKEDYGLEKFCKKVINNLDKRCQNYCYPIRLEQTAKYAKENGYTAITTTLLVSPYQKHNIIKEQGEKIAKNYGLDFVYKDFREGFRQRTKQSKRIRFIYAKILWMYFFDT